MINEHQRFAILMLMGFCQRLLVCGRLTKLQERALKKFVGDARKAFGSDLEHEDTDKQTNSKNTKIIYGVFDAQ